MIPIDWHEARSAAERATQDVAELLSNAPDGSAPVPLLDWNIAEVGAHLVTVATGYIDFARGEPSALGEQSMDELNEQRLGDYTVRDTVEIANDLVRESKAFLSTIAEDDSRMSLSGVQLDRGTAAGVWLGELRIHELDVSRALGRRWTMSREEALIVTYAGLAVVHKFVDERAARGLHATFEVRFRRGETVSMKFDNGELTVIRGGARKADCRITADPLWTLLVGYGRISHWSAGLRGKVLMWGRKPWLALRFNRLVERV